MTPPHINRLAPQGRRFFLRQSAALAILAMSPVSAWSRSASADSAHTIQRIIPSTGQRVPAIGMGSWLTFDVAPSGPAMKTRIEILETFFQRGGQVIDSSPMYGRSEAVIGQCLKTLGFPEAAFSATKVWTSGKQQGIDQMRESERLWQTNHLNLMQVHNLVDWKTQIATLLDWKEKGRIQYIGITTYGGLRHEEMKNIMRNYPLDFIQLTYNILDREAEAELLPLAIKNNIAVLANRPLQGGRLFTHIRNKPLPDWASEYSCSNWAQFFLKFILAHPAITCAIPATSQVAHMQENMGALQSKVPGLNDQDKMARYFRQIM